MTLPWRGTTPEIANEVDSRYETPGGAQNKVDTAYYALLHLLKLAVTGLSDGSEAAIARYSTPYGTTYDWLKDRLDAADTREKDSTYLYAKKVIVFGDSISAGQDTFIPWTVPFYEYMQSVNGTFTNKAIGGNDIAMTTTIIESVTDLNSYDICIVMIGTNNINGTVKQTMDDANEMYNAFENYTGDLYVVTPFHREIEVGGAGYQCLSQISNALYSTFSQRWKVVNGYDAGYLELYDAVHPTTESSKKINEWIIKMINGQNVHYTCGLFKYVHLPVTSATADVVLAKGLITSVTGCEHYLTIDCPTTTEGIQVINLNYGTCVDSWLSNTLYTQYTGVAMEQPSGIPIPVVFKNESGVRQVTFNGSAGKVYRITLIVNVPNTQIDKEI
jgi:hypothetical protein